MNERILVESTQVPCHQEEPMPIEDIIEDQEGHVPSHGDSFEAQAMNKIPCMLKRYLATLSSFMKKFLKEASNKINKKSMYKGLLKVLVLKT